MAEDTPQGGMTFFKCLARQLGIPVAVTKPVHPVAFSLTSSRVADLLPPLHDLQHHIWSKPDFLSQVIRQNRNILFFSGVWIETTLTVSTLSALALGYKVYVLRSGITTNNLPMSDTQSDGLSRSGIHVL